MIESLLLFDQVIIPTNDFMPLGLLLGVLGERVTAQLLDSDVVKFARFVGGIAYIGNGGGITVSQIFGKDKKTPKAFSAPSNERIRSVLDGLPSVVDKIGTQRLALRSTIEFSLVPAGGAFDQLVYDEVARCPTLISGTGLIHLNRLSGIRPDEVRGLSSIVGEDQGDDIFQVLRVAQACMEARAAEISSCDDVYTSDQVAELFKTAMRRVSDKFDPSIGYGALKQMADLPDVGDVALKNKPIIEDIMKLRSSVSGTQFRTWFHENCRGDPKIASKEYISLLHTIPFVQSSGGRTIRFLTQAAVAVSVLPFDPLLGLAAGTTASAIDFFLTERIFKGSTPKIFLERLGNIVKPS